MTNFDSKGLLHARCTALANWQLAGKLGHHAKPCVLQLLHQLCLLCPFARLFIETSISEGFLLRPHQGSTQWRQEEWGGRGEAKVGCSKVVVDSGKRSQHHYTFSFIAVQDSIK